jgi:hypothetical protein
LATVTAINLINVGLRKADLVSGFIDTTDGGEAYDLLNEALESLWNILYESGGHEYATTTKPFSTVANQADYPLATIAGTDFYRLLGIDQYYGGRWVDCPRFEWAERNRYQWQSGGIFKYCIINGGVRLAPTATGINSMQVDYMPLPPSATVSSSALDLQGPWRRYATLWLAVEFKLKAQQDASERMVQLQAVEAEIRAAAKKRDSNKPTTMVDVQQIDGLLVPIVNGDPFAP